MRWCRARCSAPRSHPWRSVSWPVRWPRGRCGSRSRWVPTAWSTTPPVPRTPCSFAATRCCWSPSTSADLAPGSSPDLTRRTSIGDAVRARGNGGPRPHAGAAALARGHPRRRRGLRSRPVVPRHSRGVRRGARAVRPEDRRLPGDQAPVRGDARDQRVASPRPRGTPPVRSPTTIPCSTSSRRSSPGPICFDGAVSVAKSCIQVLGGIGFTFEHDAHLYLRRALALRSLVGPTGRYAARLADLAATDTRRVVRVDLADAEESFRAEVRERAAADRRAARRGAARGPGGERIPDSPLARAARPGRRPGAAARHRRGARSRRGVATRPEDRCLGRADDHRPRHRRAAQALRRADAARRDPVVPAVQRTRSGLRPRVAEHAGRARPGELDDRARLAADRPEGVDLAGPRGRLGDLPGADEPRREAARRDHLLPRRHGQRRASRSARCASSPARRCSTRSSSTTSSCPTTAWSGEVDGGWKLARTTLANERVAMAGSQLGVSRRAGGAAARRRRGRRGRPPRRDRSVRGLGDGGVPARHPRDAALPRRTGAGAGVERGQAGRRTQPPGLRRARRRRPSATGCSAATSCPAPRCTSCC